MEASERLSVGTEGTKDSQEDDDEEATMVAPINHRNLTQKMWYDAAAAACPLAIHLEYVAKNLHQSQESKTKWKVNDLENKSQYKAWRYKLTRDIAVAGLSELVEELIKTPKVFERTNDGECYGEIKFYEVGVQDGKEGVVTPKQAHDFMKLGSAVRGSLRGKAIELAMEINADNLVDIVRVLNEQECDVAAEEAEWTTWSEWVACSKTCGGGERHRSRHCVIGEYYADDQCGAEEPLQEEVCNEQECGPHTGDRGARADDAVVSAQGPRAAHRPGV